MVPHLNPIHLHEYARLVTKNKNSKRNRSRRTILLTTETFIENYIQCIVIFEIIDFIDMKSFIAFDQTVLIFKFVNSMFFVGKFQIQISAVFVHIHFI